MSRSLKLSELLKGGSDEYEQLLAVSDKARKRHRRPKEQEAPPIGHFLAVTFFDGSEAIETLFMDNVVICNKYTVFYFTKNYLEVYPMALESEDIDLCRAKFYYKNNTSIEIQRIS